MAPSRSTPAKLTSRTQATLNGFFNPPNSSSTRVSKWSPPTKSQSQSKGAVPTGSDRVLTDVLLAIKPVHLANIASGQKNHEFRKYRLRDAVTRLWLYETGDGGKGRASITHIAVIPASVRHTPGSVPTEPFGIGNTDFNGGLKESKYGYPVLELYELVRPVSLAEMKNQWGMGGAPMGWRYVRTDLWEDSWGEDQDRAQKVIRVF